MICVAINDQNLIEDGRILWKEAKELNLIFNSIFRKLKSNKY